MIYFISCYGYTYSNLKFAPEFQVDKMIPKLCKKILKCKDEWIPQTKPVVAKHSKPGPSSSEDDHSSLVDLDEDSIVCPVIPYSSFQERVRSIDPLVSTDFIRISGNYLQDMGEVSCFASGICGILLYRS